MERSWFIIRWNKELSKLAPTLVLAGVTIGLLLSSYYLFSLQHSKINDQKQTIQKLKNSHRQLISDKKVLVAQRAKTETDYEDLSHRYFALRQTPVSRGERRDPIMEYRAQLETFLRERGSPLASYVDTLILGESTTGISAKLVVGIAMVESVGGIRNASSYNAWGRKARGGGYQAFPSWPDAILNQFNYIQQRWNSSDPSRLRGYATDPRWASKVSSIMGQI